MACKPAKFIHEVERNGDIMSGLVLGFGNELRNMRIMKNLSIRDVAERAGVTSVYISEIERDRKIPSDELIAKLAVIYNVEEKILFERFKRVSEDMLEELVNHPNLFDVIFEVSRGKITEEKKHRLYKQIAQLYKELQEE